MGKRKEIIEEYVDAVTPGMQEILKMVGKDREEAGAKWVRKNGVTDSWPQFKELFTLLKSKTSGDARNIIMGVPMDKGWEA